MTRSAWKGTFITKCFFKTKYKKKIWCRNSSIPPKLIGQIVSVHNGQKFKNIFITKEKVGFKFGEFVFTRKYTQKYKLKQKKSATKTKVKENKK